MWAFVVVLAALLSAVSVLLLIVLRRARRQPASRPGAFRCRLRKVSDPGCGITNAWEVGAVDAAWVHDVLLVRRGRFPVTTRALPVRFPDSSVSALLPHEVKGLGVDPVVLRLRLDDGDLIDVAAPAAMRERLVGPFLAACVTQGSDPGSPRH